MPSYTAVFLPGCQGNGVPVAKVKYVSDTKRYRILDNFSMRNDEAWRIPYLTPFLAVLWVRLSLTALGLLYLLSYVGSLYL
jgi:hypothetical protein